MIVHLAWLQPLDSFQRLPYVCESKWSSIISEFRLGVEGLGNKNPRTGYNRKQFCPVCPQLQPNSGIHLLFSCSSLSRLRVDTGISSFLTACTVLGVSLDEAYQLFISGFDSKRKQISQESFRDRAKCMHDMRKLWLTKW